MKTPRTQANFRNTSTKTRNKKIPTTNVCYFLSFIRAKIKPTQNSKGSFKITVYKYIHKNIYIPKKNKKGLNY